MTSRITIRREIEENLDSLNALPLTGAELARIATLQSIAAETRRNDEAGINPARGI